MVITHSLFSVVYLLFNKSRYNIYLVGLFLSVIFFHAGGILNHDPGNKGLVFPLLNPSYILAFGPLLYFYTLSIMRETVVIKRLWWLFLLPFFIYNLAFTFILHPPPPPSAMNAVVERPSLPVLLQVFHILIFLSFLLYPILIYNAIRNNYTKSGSFYSFKSESTSLKWVLVLAIFCSALFFVVIFAERVIISDSGYRALLHPLAFLVFVYALSFYSFKQPILYANQNHVVNGEAVKVPERKAEKADIKAGQGLKEELRQNYLQKLNTVIENEKPYLDSKLRITDLARKLEIPVNHLSKVINEEYEKNFFQYINEYRVKYAQEILKDHSYHNYTLVAIALESGFNSKSSFNSLFKQHTGYTPSEFRSQTT